MFLFDQSLSHMMSFTPSHQLFQIYSTRWTHLGRKEKNLSKGNNRMKCPMLVADDNEGESSVTFINISIFLLVFLNYEKSEIWTFCFLFLTHRIEGQMPTEQSVALMKSRWSWTNLILYFSSQPFLLFKLTYKLIQTLMLYLSSLIQHLKTCFVFIVCLLK